MKLRTLTVLLCAAAYTVLSLHLLRGSSGGPLLPAVVSLAALPGIYLAGRRLGGALTGWLAAAALLAAPLYTDAFLRPAADSAVTAAVVWSLFFYLKGQYPEASVIALAAVIIEPCAAVLPLSYLAAELSETRLRNSGRLVMFAAPAVWALAWTRGACFHLPGSAEMVLSRIRLLTVPLLAGDVRWLPVTVSLAALVKGRGKDTWNLPFVLVLMFPALFYPPGRLLFAVLALLVIFLHMVRERLYTTKVSWVFILVPAFTVLSGWKGVLPIVPLVLLGSLVMIRRYMDRMSQAAIGAVHIAMVISTYL